MRRRGVKLWGNYKLCVGAAALPRPSDMRRLSFGRGRTPPLRITWSAARVERATARVAPTQGLGCGGQRRGVGEIGEAPPVAEEASRFRGSAPIGGHDSGRESAGTTVGNRRPLRGTGSAVRGVHGLPRRSADWFAMTFLEGRVICGARPAGGGGILCAGWGDLFSIYTQILFFACYN